MGSPQAWFVDGTGRVLRPRALCGHSKTPIPGPLCLCPAQLCPPRACLPLCPSAGTQQGVTSFFSIPVLSQASPWPWRDLHAQLLTPRAWWAPDPEATQLPVRLCAF